MAVFFEVLIVLIVLFLCCYIIIDRVCKCSERNEQMKAFAVMIKDGRFTDLIEKFGDKLK